MINILNPAQKRDIRAARVNVLLVQYAIMLVALAFLIAVIYGIGFWLISKEKQAVNIKIASQSEQAKAYANVEKEANEFRKNLKIAQSILGKETSYSAFLTTLAKDLPAGTILTNLSIGGPAATTQKGLTIDARVNSYAKVLELKNRLEQSVLFENVSIVNATRPDDISKLTGMEARYPYEASFNVKLSSPNPTTGGIR